ncbi:MAG TPA: hypothetical protein VGN90_03895 [Pyrinomonadaceae bacterium]|nr:hypothetical protein [Pyrinomonadaceae bacterium]
MENILETNGELVPRVFTAVPNSENGWPLRPFQIVSLQTVLEKHAFAFYEIGKLLKGLQLLVVIPTTPEFKVKPIGSETAKSGIKAMTMARFFCDQVGLQNSVKGVERYLAILKKEDTTYSDLFAGLGEVERRISDELGAIHFLHVPEAKVAFYESSQLFGEAVARKFPKAIEDIQESGKCFAVGRYTACVFHLMRVMERGVQRLGKKLKVSIPVEEKDWGMIGSHVNGALKRLPNSTVSERRRHTRYAKAAVYLDNVRESWRNPTMHPKETYTEEEAESAFRFVKQYMEHLSKIL